MTLNVLKGRKTEIKPNCNMYYLLTELISSWFVYLSNPEIPLTQPFMRGVDNTPMKSVHRQLSTAQDISEKTLFASNMRRTIIIFLNYIVDSVAHAMTQKLPI